MIDNPVDKYLLNEANLGYAVQIDEQGWLSRTDRIIRYKLINYNIYLIRGRASHKHRKAE